MQLFNRDGILAIYEQDQKIQKKKNLIYNLGND